MATKKVQKKAEKPAKAAADGAVKRVPPRIVKRVTAAAAKPAEPVCASIDTEQAVAFAMSIAEEMKKSAAQADQSRSVDEIRLSSRPTSRSQGKQTVKFPASDLKEFRKLLLDARAQALSGVDAMKATGFNESDDREADGGDGTNQTLRLQALGQMGNIHRTIQQIDEALHRIDDGTYGVCTVCGQLIRKPRLLNQPFVLTCMECQSEMERGAK
ncbi:MAG: TraR/DksA family transcriptional regulator [Kiritimatiellia bacterium]